MNKNFNNSNKISVIVGLVVGLTALFCFLNWDSIVTKFTALF